LCQAKCLNWSCVRIPNSSYRFPIIIDVSDRNVPFLISCDIDFVFPSGFPVAGQKVYHQGHGIDELVCPNMVTEPRFRVHPAITSMPPTSRQQAVTTAGEAISTSPLRSSALAAASPRSRSLPCLRSHTTQLRPATLCHTDASHPCDCGSATRTCVRTPVRLRVPCLRRQDTVQVAASMASLGRPGVSFRFLAVLTSSMAQIGANSPFT
jgi:hypothetical protein